MSLKTSASSSRSIRRLWNQLFFCPNCSTWRTSRVASTTSRRVDLTKQRYSSTLVSGTAVNATKKVPSRNRELHDALQDLQKKVPAHVNLSRLQLAIASLETESPTTRIAVLGVNRSTTARQIVRLLLADPLEDEQSWEAQLRLEDEEEKGGILIRYGKSVTSSLPPSRSAISTISIPAPLLQKHNLEILISSVFSPKSIGPENTIDSDTLLTPFAGTPTAASGRQTIVSFPVHKTMILANGLDEFQALARMLALTQYEADSEKALVDAMVNLNGNVGTQGAGNILVVDTSKLDEGLKRARESIQNASQFEVLWGNSGLPKFSNWLSNSAILGEKQPPQTLPVVVQAILDGAAIGVQRQSEAEQVQGEDHSVKPATRDELDAAIDTFLADAHHELQTGLARAFKSRSWDKLAWYKLFWRVDDVSLILTDLVQQYWLRESSLVVFELLGRLHQARLVNFVSYDGRLIEFATTNGEDLPPPHLRRASAQQSSDYLETPDQPTLKSSELMRARQNFLDEIIPTMTSTAQSSLIKSIGFSASTVGLSAMAYVSTLTPSLYECGAIFALGVVFALRRLQKQWETSRDDFRKEIFDVGRSALRSTEEFMRLAVREGGRKEVDDVEVQIRSEALAAIERAKRALDEIR